MHGPHVTIPISSHSTESVTSGGSSPGGGQERVASASPTRAVATTAAAIDPEVPKLPLAAPPKKSAEQMLREAGARPVRLTGYLLLAGLVVGTVAGLLIGYYAALSDAPVPGVANDTVAMFIGALIGAPLLGGLGAGLGEHVEHSYEVKVRVKQKLEAARVARLEAAALEPNK